MQRRWGSPTHLHISDKKYPFPPCSPSPESEVPLIDVPHKLEFNAGLLRDPCGLVRQPPDRVSGVAWDPDHERLMDSPGDTVGGGCGRSRSEYRFTVPCGRYRGVCAREFSCDGLDGVVRGVGTESFTSQLNGGRAWRTTTPGQQLCTALWRRSVPQATPGSKRRFSAAAAAATARVIFLFYFSKV